ncbi:methyl-accepting chemotaxis protein [Massilia sp. H6]|uniref:methyl-accepting chemotaxis protein n=1 Tax=Massilia sp. H6 TaxID=2970464 RepID=UPI0021681F5E|nr:methyl-accepting chemotaxis protein [Massilia sp. H6]UVW27307.1 methyl-accepting chemotaxis protein [Massilia sp. H6]
MLSRLKIGPKLLLAPGVVLLLLVILSSSAYYAMVRQHQSLQTIVGPRAVQMRSTTELVAQAQRVHADTYKLLTWISSSFSRARIELLITQIHRQHAAIERSFVELARLTQPGSAERRHVAQAAQAHRAYVAKAREAVELAQADQTIGAAAMIKPEAAFAAMAERMTLLASLERDLSEQASSSAAADFRIIAGLMPVLILLAVAVSLAITMAVRRALLLEIRGIGAAALGLASGDLTIQAREYGDDEIGETSRALDAGIRNLSGTLRTVLESARTIGNTSREISLGSLNLNSRSVFRSRSLEATAASMQELADTVAVTATSARAANQLAQSVSTSARQGGLTALRMAATMATVKEGALRAAEVASVIDALASEAGALALNAALEAARSGVGAQDGTSFVEAAGEVRALAQRAAGAAREVRELAIRSVAEIEGCTECALDAGSNMAQIASSVRAVEDIVDSIGSASAGQANGLAHVSQAIVRMDEVTHQNCALVEEAAAAARTLQMQALALSRSVAAFRLDATATAAPAPVTPQKESGAPQATPARDQPRERRLRERSHLRLASSRK